MWGRVVCVQRRRATEAPAAVLREVLGAARPCRRTSSALALAEAWKRDQRVLDTRGETRRLERVAATNPEESGRLLKRGLVNLAD